MGTAYFKIGLRNSLFLGHEELRHSIVDFSIFPESVEGKSQENHI